MCFWDHRLDQWSFLVQMLKLAASSLTSSVTGGGSKKPTRNMNVLAFHVSQAQQQKLLSQRPTQTYFPES